MKSEKVSSGNEEVLGAISRYLPEMVALRHDLHSHPELAYEEHRTADIVATLLKKWGYEVATGVGKTGVVGRLKVGEGNHSIGLRADFDALPIEEQTNLEYSSKNEGKMHACGHDGHTTMLLTAARYLAETRNFNGTVNVIFQPAEEGFAGAQAMIDDGLFEKFPCDAVYAMHNWPDIPAGEIAVNSGPFMPASDNVSIRVIGKGGHGAVPQKTIDPIAAGAAIVTALQTIVSRNVPPLEAAIITVGTFHAGFANNVIPDTAEMELTVRCFSAGVRDMLQSRIEKLVKAQAESFGATAEVKYHRLYPMLFNHKEETDFAVGVARDTFGKDKVDAQLTPPSVSEDFAFMLQAKRGAYLLIGNGDSASLHSPNYNFNDKLIPLGGCYWVRLAQTYLR